jgi:diguanylate cyclase (GGDEF)-like protein
MVAARRRHPSPTPRAAAATKPGQAAKPTAVLALIASLLLGAAALDRLVLHLHLDPQLSGTAAVVFLGTAAAFAVSEALVMHIEFGRNAHSVSLGELVLVVSLFFLPAGGLPIARLLGGGAALIFVRRQRPIKVAFNASLWTLDVATASLVFRALGGSLDAGAAHLVIPATAAALTAAAVDSLAVNTVISIASREVRTRAALQFVGTCMVNGVICSTAAAISVGALAWTPWLLPPILVFIAAAMVSFSRFGALRQQHRSMKVLYDFTDELARTPRGQAVVHTVLERVVELLRVERAALVLDDREGHLQVSEVQAGRRPTSRTVDLAAAPELIDQILSSHAPIVVKEGDDRPAGTAFLEFCSARDALLAPVRSRQGLRGALVVLDRLGDVATFTDDDARLLQTLAHHAGTAVSNSQLVNQLNYDSTHDSLTGLANRAHFQQRLANSLASPGGTAVLLMDLDRFKEVNDTLGHHHGDLLLQQIAARLQQQLRRKDLLARLGGDEFAILMRRVTEGEAVATAHRLRAALATPMQLQGVDMEVNTSIGIAMRAADVATRSEATAARKRPSAVDDTMAVAMLQHADVAMYSAKRSGTGVEVYRKELDDHSPRRLALASGMRAAIEDGQLTLRYQPQARLADGSIGAVEALVRWEHPSYGVVSPEDFIAIAEQTGQIRELTQHVLETALRDCAEWNRVGLEVGVSVNVSVRNLLEADLVNAVSRLLTTHEVPSRLLTLEITESHLMADAARTRQTLEQLAAIGVRLSVDDFGTGYSSLAYLKQLPVREVKIDKSFIMNLANDHSDAAIVEAILQLSHTLNLEVVAEGVESAATEQRLIELGCDYMQGFHLARPMRIAEMTAWLERRPDMRARGVLRALPSGASVASLPTASAGGA